MTGSSSVAVDLASLQHYRAGDGLEVVSQGRITSLSLSLCSLSLSICNFQHTHSETHIQTHTVSHTHTHTHTHTHSHTHTHTTVPCWLNHFLLYSAFLSANGITLKGI